MSSKFNPDKQHTLKTSISISGTGLHTGILVDMVLNPANAGFGIQFKRIDLPGEPVIKADWCESEHRRTCSGCPGRNGR
jgi:UDP-3-O-[3-hydroxymyristoyl] N-acetylglucosamine deacetylase/3-hydroxyacyl-[acyl-carrier-protein] dehydratase